MKKWMLAAAVLVAACDEHEHGDGPTADEYIYDCSVKKPGVSVFATDESFQAFINSEAKGPFTENDAMAPKLQSPAPGSTLSVKTPPLVSFMVPAESALVPRPDAPTPPRPGRSLWSRIARALSPVGTAYAHCAAVNGPNYFFRLSDTSGTALYTALLSVPEFTPSAEKWQQALAGREGKTVKLTLARAVLVGGSIVPPGPYVAKTPITFTLGQ